ncbi:MAG: sigma-54-dependent transcriptional regulator [Thermodesulfobacteriota bacterium]
MSNKILIVDDEKSIRESLAGILKDEGFEVSLARDGEDAVRMVKEVTPDVVMLDIWMPGIDGIEVLKHIKDRYPIIAVIMISGHGTIDTAVKATKLGAYDFIEKPLYLEKVILTVQHALEERKLKEENRLLRRDIEKRYELIGESDPIHNLRGQIKRIAPTNSWVLITGENGTGKELVARNIHLLSKRKENPFVEVNCAAIPEDLIESELFGHEKGSFTGATGMRKGKFDLAHKGTIFLDEIGDMSLKTQAKVLRVLQEQNFVRVGGTENICVDVRVIAATNKDLKQEMENGNFREDLYYRLNVIPFHVPALRERKEDIPLFVKYFLKELVRNMGRYSKDITPDALTLLKAYQWPGNVRELKNLVESLIIMSPEDLITDRDLPDYIMENSKRDYDMDILSSNSLREARQEFEKEFILRKLEENKGSMSKTADCLGIERTSLYRKIKSYGIDIRN